MVEIESVLKPDLQYIYTMRCYNHPWEHREIGSLKGATLVRTPKADEPGFIVYEFKLARMQKLLPMQVEAPNIPRQDP